jgi:nonsense-mediated mRNA decay protein 3
VQLRQRVLHKRTFLYLEQLILKHGAHEKSINITEMHDGLDFQYKQQSHSNRIISFVMNNFVARHKSSRQLVSHDEQSGDSKYKYSNILELAPICKDDLVILPPKLQKVLGGIGPLILVYKITTSIHIVDIHTMRTHEIDSTHYWKYMFKAMATRDRLTRFVVLNVEEVDFDVNTSRAAAKNKFRMVRLEVARESEFGVNDRTFIVNTHLGEFINFNDTVSGYDLDQMTLNDLDEYELDPKKNKH